MTIVVFRTERRKDGETIALFPTIPADVDGSLCQSYQHTGQHSAANYWHVINHTRPATPAENGELMAELVERGYTDLAPRLKVGWRCHNNRRMAAAVS